MSCLEIMYSSWFGVGNGRPGSTSIRHFTASAAGKANRDPQAAGRRLAQRDGGAVDGGDKQRVAIARALV
jgi:ABC-type hemin transport system ATPase subunit